MARAAIGIGANLGDARATVVAAVARLAEAGDVVAISSLYRTVPWGVKNQPAFCNAVALLETALAPLPLLVKLKALERELGRETTFRWGPRMIDLDILTYDDLHLTTDELTIPHPRLAERAFVLVPLAEIDERYGPALAMLPDADRHGVVALTGERL